MRKELIMTEVREEITIVHFMEKSLLDMVVAEELKRNLLNLVSEGAEKMIINFSNVDFMSSSFISVLIVVHAQMESAEGQLRLCGLAPSLLKLFEMTNLDRMFKILATEGDAVRSME